MTRPVLLDVNILVALFDPDHVHHDVAHEWFADNRSRGWATCAITENGFVRVVSNPAYGSGITRPVDLVDRLRQFCRLEGHQYWTDAASLRDETLFDCARVRARHLTDVYLVGLAHRHGGALATFDRGIPSGAIVGAGRQVLEVIAPLDSDPA